MNGPVQLVGILPNERSQLDLALFGIGNLSRLWLENLLLVLGVYFLWPSSPFKFSCDAINEMELFGPSILRSVHFCGNAKVLQKAQQVSKRLEVAGK
jgi:hypothetical protein